MLFVQVFLAHFFTLRRLFLKIAFRNYFGDQAWRLLWRSLLKICSKIAFRNHLRDQAWRSLSKTGSKITLEDCFQDCFEDHSWRLIWQSFSKIFESDLQRNLQCNLQKKSLLKVRTSNDHYNDSGLQSHTGKYRISMGKSL